MDNVKHGNISSVQEKTREIVRLVYKWNSTWNAIHNSNNSNSSGGGGGGNNSSNNKMSSSSNKLSTSKISTTSPSTSSSSSSSINYTAESVDIVDRLIHLLLDIIETK